MKKDNTEYIEVDLDELMNAMGENIKGDLKDCNDLVNLDGFLKREIYIIGSVDGIAPNINGYIRFWNNYDKEHNIPIEERKPIKIYIDSVGGATNDALTIMDSIALSETPVWTIGMGKVWSSGFEIFYMGHKRIAYPNASFLWHEGSIGINPVDTNKFRNYAAYYEKELGRFNELFKSHSNITDDFFEKNKKDDVWMFPEEAMEIGVVDEISKELI